MNLIIKLPQQWTPEMVDFLFDFVHQLYQAIWEEYGSSLCEYWEDNPPSFGFMDDSQDVVSGKV